MLYHELQNRLEELRQENIKPKYIILGYEKVRQLEEELSSQMLRHDQSTEDFMKRGAAGRISGCDFFINQVKPDKVAVLTEREVDMIEDEIEFKKKD